MNEGIITVLLQHEWQEMKEWHVSLFAHIVSLPSLLSFTLHQFGNFNTLHKERTANEGMKFNPVAMAVRPP